MPIQTRSKRTANSRHRDSWDANSHYQSYQQSGSASRPAYFIRHIWDSYCQSDAHLWPAQIERLGDHKYSAMDVSWLDELCMKRFWDTVVQFYPMWLAPNLITLVGLIVNLVTVFILSHFCFSASEAAPSWAYLQAALGLFIYQTLDATDGKQARRTQSASPLGELFDHGCDSMTQIFVTMNVAYALQLGAEPYIALLFTLFSIVTFYCAHWSTYCTGQLRFSRFDVTEAQMCVIGILVTTAVFSPGIWNLSIFWIRLKIIVLTVGGVLNVWQLFGYLRVIVTEGVGKNGSTVAGTSVLYPCFPLMAVCVPFVMIYFKSPSGVYDRNITLICLCFGAVAAKATNRLIIAHMSRSGLEVWDWIYLCPLVMILNQYYDFFFDEYKLLLCSTIYAYASLFLFCVLVCRQFCDYLQINCFTLGPREHPMSPQKQLSSPTYQGKGSFSRLKQGNGKN